MHIFGGSIWLYYRLYYYGSPAARFHSYQSRRSEVVQGVEHFPRIEHPHGYILVTSFTLSLSPYVSAALIIIFTVAFATPYEDCGLLIYIYVLKGGRSYGHTRGKTGGMGTVWQQRRRRGTGEKKG